MTRDGPHDHRPDHAAQLAAIAAARAVILGDDPAAITAAEAAPCTVCAAIAGFHWWMSMAALIINRINGQRSAFVSQELRLAFLAAVKETERDLGSEPN